jgi:hypothetical protein
MGADPGETSWASTKDADDASLPVNSGDAGSSAELLTNDKKVGPVG